MKKQNRTMKKSIYRTSPKQKIIDLIGSIISLSVLLFILSSIIYGITNTL